MVLFQSSSISSLHLLFQKMQDSQSLVYGPGAIYSDVVNPTSLLFPRRMKLLMFIYKGF